MAARRPAIFGTLRERALNPIERHKLGAHYTPRAYVERLVMPTVVEPVRAEWDAAKAAAVTHEHHFGLRERGKRFSRFLRSVLPAPSSRQKLQKLRKGSPVGAFAGSADFADGVLRKNSSRAFDCGDDFRSSADRVFLLANQQVREVRRESLHFVTREAVPPFEFAQGLFAAVVEKKHLQCGHTLHPSLHASGIHEVQRREHEPAGQFHRPECLPFGKLRCIQIVPHALPHREPDCIFQPTPKLAFNVAKLSGAKPDALIVESSKDFAPAFTGK